MLLPAFDIPFGRLHRRVAKQELNLFELASGLMAEAGTSATKIAGCEVVKADLLGVAFRIAPKWSNKTDLINAHDVRGQIGLSYDLSALPKLISPGK
jgi:hypothetical protein